MGWGRDFPTNSTWGRGFFKPLKYAFASATLSHLKNDFLSDGFLGRKCDT